MSSTGSATNEVALAERSLKQVLLDSNIHSLLCFLVHTIIAYLPFYIFSLTTALPLVYLLLARVMSAPSQTLPMVRPPLPGIRSLTLALFPSTTSLTLTIFAAVSSSPLPRPSPRLLPRAADNRGDGGLDGAAARQLHDRRVQRAHARTAPQVDGRLRVHVRRKVRHLLLTFAHLTPLICLCIRRTRAYPPLLSDYSYLLPPSSLRPCPPTLFPPPLRPAGLRCGLA